jgi:polysaccharide transporter, PST family
VIGGLSRLLWKNTLAQAGAQLVGLAVGLATAMLLSRHLGVEGYAEFNYVFAFLYFFVGVGDFGVNVVVVREVAQRRDRAAEILGSVLILKLAAAAACLLAAWAVIWLMDFPPGLRAALAVYALVLPVLAGQLPGVIFQVLGRLEYPALIVATTRCLGLALTAWVVWAGGGVVAAVAAALAGEFAGMVALWIAARQFVRLRWFLDLGIWRRVLRSSLPLGLAGLLGAIVNRADFLMLERMTNLREVGLFAAAYRVTNLLEMLPLMIMATVYPLMSLYAVEDPGRLRTLYRKSVLLLALAGVPLGIAVAAFAPLIMRIIFGVQFESAATVLTVLVWASVFLYLAISGGNLLISVGRERQNLAILAVGAVVNVALNICLIPGWGALGAAWASVATFLVILLATTVAAWRVLDRPAAGRAVEAALALGHVTSDPR